MTGRYPRSLTCLVMVTLVATLPVVALAEGERRRRVEWIIDGALTVGWLAMLPTMFVDTTTDARIGTSFRGPQDVEALELALARGRIDRPFACLGYFIHFDMSGEVRRGVSLSVAPQEDGIVAGVVGVF